MIRAIGGAFVLSLFAGPASAACFDTAVGWDGDLVRACVERSEVENVRPDPQRSDTIWIWLKPSLDVDKLPAEYSYLRYAEMLEVRGITREEACTRLAWQCR